MRFLISWPIILAYLLLAALLEGFLGNYFMSLEMHPLASLLSPMTAFANTSGAILLPAYLLCYRFTPYHRSNWLNIVLDWLTPLGLTLMLGVMTAMGAVAHGVAGKEPYEEIYTKSFLTTFYSKLGCFVIGSFITALLANEVATHQALKRFFPRISG
jgi:hypothetical protein